ncbi:MAG: transglycosylase SLT domain-containing protein [Kofleriaceae bacterium]
MDTTNLVVGGLGLGGVLWMRSKLDGERRAREEAERQRDIARSCAARSSRPANSRSPSLTPSATRLASRAFDAIFAAHGQGIPVPYLRSLALHESNLNPRATTGGASGLFQVIEIVRTDFNARAGTTYTRQDLLDPAVNTTIAASALALIARSYAQHHPRVPNLRADWRNPQFVALLTFGWNAGWSERAGVGRIAQYLEQRGVVDLTIDAVHKAAQAAGASPHLANPKKVAWSKAVAMRYFRELAAEPSREPDEIEMPAEYVGRPAVVVRTGPVTSPSELVATSPVTSPSQLASTPAPALEPSTPRTASASPPASAATIVSANPSGLSGPLDPYGDACGCT